MLMTKLTDDKRKLSQQQNGLVTRTTTMMKCYLALYVSSDFTHELSIDPESEDRLGNDQRHADEGDGLISESEVHEEKAFHSPHVLVARNKVDDEGVSGQREEKDWSVEAE